MKNAIKRAIEGGYKVGDEMSEPTEHGSFWAKHHNGRISDLIIWQETCFNPFFWQALGKAEGWVGGPMQIQNVKDNGIGSNPRYTAQTHTEMRPSWKKVWHNFIDHLAEGGNIDDFFNKLLTPSKRGLIKRLYANLPLVKRLFM